MTVESSKLLPVEQHTLAKKSSDTVMSTNTANSRDSAVQYTEHIDDSITTAKQSQPSPSSASCSGKEPAAAVDADAGFMSFHSHYPSGETCMVVVNNSRNKNLR